MSQSRLSVSRALLFGPPHWERGLFVNSFIHKTRARIKSVYALTHTHTLLRTHTLSRSHTHNGTTKLVYGIYVWARTRTRSRSECSTWLIAFGVCSTPLYSRTNQEFLRATIVVNLALVCDELERRFSRALCSQQLKATCNWYRVVVVKSSIFWPINR